jgi:hypothetical protein
MEDACELCPLGTFGSEFGMLTPSCSGACPVGTYGPLAGLRLRSQCAPCPPGYAGAQCQPTASSRREEPPISQYTGLGDALGGSGFETRKAAIAKRSRAWQTATRAWER